MHGSFEQHYLRCLAHIINLAVQACLKELGVVTKKDEDAVEITEEEDYEGEEEDDNEQLEIAEEVLAFGITGFSGDVDISACCRKGERSPFENPSSKHGFNF